MTDDPGHNFAEEEADYEARDNLIELPSSSKLSDQCNLDIRLTLLSWTVLRGLGYAWSVTCTYVAVL